MKLNPKTPLTLAGCGCASLLASMLCFGAVFFVGRTASSLFERGRASEDLVQYRNTREGRTGPLAENYVDFQFRYPKSWVLKAQDSAAVNYVTVERAVDGKTYENLNVGYFSTAGSRERNESLYPQLISQLQSQFAQQFRDLRKVSENTTRVGSYDGYEALFTSTAGEGEDRVDVYTRVILLPTPDATKGVSLLMMGTSLAPDLESAEDLGKKGGLPAVLESFRFD